MELSRSTFVYMYDVMENYSVLSSSCCAYVVLPYAPLFHSLHLSHDFSLYLQELLNIIASVLHLGNIQYGSEDGGNSYITVDIQIKYLARVRIQPRYTGEYVCLQELLNSTAGVIHM